jgi:hypothetical protein
LARPVRLTGGKAGGGKMFEWSFSATAEMVVGLALLAVIVAAIFV